MDTAVTGKVNSQEKLTSSNVMLDDMVDIICSNEQFKKFLIFRNQKRAANINIFEKVAEEINERPATDGRKNTITHSQIRNKFKKLVCECKSVSLSQRTASGISRYQVEKCYGKWWDILFPLVASRKSADTSNIIEPPSYDDIKIQTPKTIWEVVRMKMKKRKVNVSQRKIKKPLNRVYSL